MNNNLNLKLWSLPMLALLAAQFISAFADNALFVIVIAILKTQPNGEGIIPLVQEFFVIVFILLAPFVGSIADNNPKNRVMLIANSIKFLGAILLLNGYSPLLGYTVVGIGAAIYSPAKYGILTQFFDEKLLIKANGLLESTTIVAILLGVVIGGLLADNNVNNAIYIIATLYVASVLLTLFIPKINKEHLDKIHNPKQLFSHFISDIKKSLQDPRGKLSLITTSVFWGTGSTLRLALFAWVPAALLITDNSTPANLMAAVSIGIVLGAVIAGKFLNFSNLRYSLYAGGLLGPMIVFMSLQDSLYIVVAILIIIGILGGILVIPFNALLQEFGHKTIGSGRTLAVQNLFENFSILIFVGVYYVANHLQYNPIYIVVGFGVVITLNFLYIIKTNHKTTKG